MEGLVTLEGKPLAGATVTLQRADGPPEERTYIGETDAEGRYRIAAAHDRAAGAPPGTYFVFITSIKIPPDINETTKLPPDPVPIKWRNGSETLEVPAGGTTEANFPMTAR